MRLVLVPLALITLATVGACDRMAGDKAPASATNSAAVVRPVDSEVLSIRPVLATAAPPCDATNPDYFAEREFDIGACHKLGTPIADSTDVASAQIAPGEPRSVMVTLKPEAAKRLDTFARESVGLMFALVSHGTILGTPVITQPELAPDIEVFTGNPESAQKLLAELSGIKR